MFRLLNAVVRLAPLATVVAARSSRTTAAASLSGRQLLLFSSSTAIRGGGAQEEEPQQQDYETLSAPAPGSPFHYAFPVHDLEAAKQFYGTVLGCAEGRSSEKWQDYSLNGHQIVCHWVGNDYRCQDYYNPVDGTYVHYYFDDGRS